MRSRAQLISMGIHGGLALALGFSLPPSVSEQLPVLRTPRTPVVWAAGGRGRGTSGGSGGDHGRLPTDSRVDDVPPSREPVRQTALGARLHAIVFADTLQIPDVPEQTDLLFGPDLAHVAVPEPGLMPVGAPRVDGVASPTSAGDGLGVGGRHGSGVGSEDGHGVGAGPYDPGSLDRLPVLLYKPDDPPYPPAAKEAGARGEVILQIRVGADGSTAVQTTLRSVPHCVEAAWRLAEQYRWKPGLKDGVPVATTGILIVRFDLTSSR